MEKDSLVMHKSVRDIGTFRKNPKECQSCKIKGNHVSADAWCCECAEAFCQKCATYHSTNRALRHHRVFAVEELAAEPLLGHFTEFELCRLHGDKKIEVYCKDHDELCCVVCVTSSHRKCADIFQIEEIARGVKGKQETREVNELLKNTRSEFEEMIKDRRQNIEDFQHQQTEIENTLKHLRLELNKHLDDLEGKVKEQMASAHGTNMSAMTYDLSHLENRRKALEDCQRIYDVSLKHGSDVKMFIEVNKLRKQQREHDYHLRKHKQLIKRVDWSFKASDQAVDPKKFMVSLGEIVVKSAPHMDIDKPFVASVALPCCFATPSVTDSYFFNSSFGSTLTAANADDENEGGNAPVSEATLAQTLYVNKTRVIGAEFLHDGRVILAANSADRYKLVVYSPGGTMDSEIRLSSLPGGMTVLNPHEIAVTFSQEQVIQFLDTDTFSTVKDVKVKGECTKISSFDGKMAVLCGRELKILSGDHTRTVPVRVNDIQSLCLGSKELLYFTRENGSELHCVNARGKEIFQYSHEDLVRPHGVAFDRGVYVYVAGYKSQTVHQLTTEGHLQKIVGTRGDVTSGPLALAFDETGEKFLQVWEQLYGNFVYIYDLPI